MERKITKSVKVGNITIGGGSRISIQSMTNTDTHDKESTLAQILSLEKRGCDIVRITVPDIDAVETIPFLKKNGVSIPIVADIHFDYKIALKCAEAGVDKIRINPGNIGSIEKVKAVIQKWLDEGTDPQMISSNLDDRETVEANKKIRHELYDSH